jgi:hypothetical protein
VLIISAAVMPLFVAAAAFAVDTIQISVWNRQMQRAADSAALAGAFALTQSSDPDGEVEFTVDAVHRDLDENYFPTLSQAELVDIGPRLGYDRTVRVRLTTQPVVPFIGFFTGAPATISVDATAAIVGDGTFCVLSLYEGEDPGIDIGGNANVNLGCGVASNSIGEEGVTATGSSSLTATPIMARGGLNGAKNNFVAPTTLQPHAAAQSDPFAGVPNPSPNASDCTATLDVGTQDDISLPTGNYCYASANIKGKISFGAGSTVTVYGGDLDFGAQAKVTAPTTTWVMTGTNGAAGDLKMNGQANLNLSAPESGPYDGILFYRDRRATNIEIKINGGSDMILRGAMYFPSSDITFNGNAGLQAHCFQMVGQLLKFRGTATLTNSCPGAPDQPGFQATYVRLVG